MYHLTLGWSPNLHVHPGSKLLGQTHLIVSMRHEPPHKILDYASASFVRILVAVSFFLQGYFMVVSFKIFKFQVNSLKKGSTV